MISATRSHKHATRTKRSTQHLSLARSDFLIELVWSRTVKKLHKYEKGQSFGIQRNRVSHLQELWCMTWFGDVLPKRDGTIGTS